MPMGEKIAAKGWKELLEGVRHELDGDRNRSA